MNLKRVPLFVVMALAATALVAPAAASASGMFYHEGKEIITPQAIEGTGTIGFEVTGVGSFHCDATLALSLSTNSGSLTEVGVETETCTAGGALAACVLANEELTKEATLTPAAASGQLVGLAHWVTFEKNGKCPLHELEVTSDPTSPITLTPDNMTATSAVAIGGHATVDRLSPPGSPLTAHATGEATVVSPNQGTYGIEE